MTRALQWAVRRTPEGWRGSVSLAASSDGRARVTVGAPGATPLGALAGAAAMAAELSEQCAVREDAAEAAGDLEGVCGAVDDRLQNLGFIPPAQAAAAASKALSVVKRLVRAIRARRRRRAQAKRAQQAQPSTAPAARPDEGPDEGPDEDGADD